MQFTLKMSQMFVPFVPLRLCWVYYQAGSLCCTRIKPLFLTCRFPPSRTHLAGCVHTHTSYIIYIVSTHCVFMNLIECMKCITDIDQNIL